MPDKKSKIGILVICCFILIMMFGYPAWAGSTPEETYNQLQEHVRQGDYGFVYDNLSDKARELMDLTMEGGFFIFFTFGDGRPPENYEQLSGREKYIAACQKNARSVGDQYSAKSEIVSVSRKDNNTVALSIKNSEGQQQDVIMVRENGGWKIGMSKEDQGSMENSAYLKALKAQKAGDMAAYERYMQQFMQETTDQMNAAAREKRAADHPVETQERAVFKRPEPVQRSAQPEPEPVVQPLPTGLCGNGVCDGDEDYSVCAQDCAELIYPFASDVESCRDSTGKVWPAYGPGCASWFLWNGCSRERSYMVRPAEEIIFHATTDSCAGCVCTNMNFCVFESKDGGWVQTQCFDLGSQPGASRYQTYAPVSDKIKIVANRCFYLKVMRKK